MKAYRPLWIALLVMAALSPVGLYLPELLQAGAAWGEWGIEEVASMVGYTPSGMRELAGRWAAPMPDYTLPGRDTAPLAHRSLMYIASALVGMVLCSVMTYGLTRWLMRRKG